MKIDDTWYIKPNGISEHDCAGGVVVRFENNKIYFAVSHEIDIDILTLPKGHVESGEDFEHTARREVEEETGLIDLKLIEFLGTKERLNFEKTSWKKTHYYLYTTTQIDAKPTDSKHEKVVWLPINEYKNHLWREQRELIEKNLDKIKSLV